MAGGRGIDLKGTRALVTGGTSGLGLAMAGALARAGASVVLTSRSAERAAAAAGGLPAQLVWARMCGMRTPLPGWSSRHGPRLGGIDMLDRPGGDGAAHRLARLTSGPGRPRRARGRHPLRGMAAGPLRRHGTRRVKVN